MNFVDTHCHLQFSDLAENIGRVMDGAASAAGVTRMVCVGTSLDDSRQAVSFAAKYSNVWAAVGVHPHEAERYVQSLAPRGVDGSSAPSPYQSYGSVRSSPSPGAASKPERSDFAEQLMTLAKKPKVVAIGEIGLDYYKDYAPKEDQVKLLHAQLEATTKLGLPFIFHVRDAFSDFWPIFDEYKIKSGVIHSFSAGPKILEQILSRGLFVGLNGIMTFTRDEPQLESARRVPLKRLLLETDAPFLAPAKYRGEICEPKHVRDTADFLADLRGESLEELAAATTRNAMKLFGLE